MVASYSYIYYTTCTLTTTMHMHSFTRFTSKLLALTAHFNIYWYVKFATNSTRSASSFKLTWFILDQSRPPTNTFFNKIVRLWNHMPSIDLSHSTDLIKRQLTTFLWNKFTSTFNSEILCTYHITCPCYRCSNLRIVVNFSQLSNSWYHRTIIL